MKKSQELQLLATIRQIIPDAKLTDDGISFTDDCGCYSEWTQEPCRLEVHVEGTFDGDGYDQREAAEGLLRTWANGNLSWSGCDCCGNELSVWVRLYQSGRKSDE